MNIFPTDRSAFASAKALDDKRLVRQASETVVLLGNVLALCDLPSAGYKPHRQPGHGLVQWLGNPVNWSWAADYAYACNLLYRELYGRECVCEAKLREMRASAIKADRRYMLPATPTEFFNGASNKALGLSFRHMPDPIEAYRCYLRARWAGDKRAPVWSGRPEPEWRTS